MNCDDIIDDNFTSEEIEGNLQKLKTNKAGDIDRLQFEHLKHGGLLLILWLKQIFWNRSEPSLLCLFGNFFSSYVHINRPTFNTAHAHATGKCVAGPLQAQRSHSFSDFVTVSPLNKPVSSIVLLQLLYVSYHVLSRTNFMRAVLIMCFWIAC